MPKLTPAGKDAWISELKPVAAMYVDQYAAYEVGMNMAKAAKSIDEKKKAAEAQGYEVGSDLAFKTFWKDGFTAETAHKDFRVHLGGRVHADAGWFAPDSNLESLGGPAGWQDGAEFRRLRLLW